MKAVFKFNLPEEQEEYQTFIDANKMQNVLFEMNQWLRKKIKYLFKLQVIVIQN